MDDFQSSDVEFEPPPQNPFWEAGKASITKMIDHALEDRIASKRKVKQLTFVKGSPSTQYIHALWWNRFNEFRSNTLHKSVEALPTAEDLERFFATIVSRVVPRTNQVPAYTWLKSAVGFTIENCVFHHKTFTLSAHERSRIATLLDDLLQEGKVTQDPTWDRRWIGAVIVRKLVCSLINQAYEEGTVTWDITLAKCLSIVLVASLGARSGDVTVAPRDRHVLPYLAFKDVEIKMTKGGSTVHDLQAVITIRNEKGDKLDPKLKRTVLVRALKSSSDSMLCPIQLLLTLALRLGNVAETSIFDVLTHTAQRKDRIVLWSYPERPVLCAFGSAGTAVTVEKPAGNHQLTHTMSEAALAAGVLVRLHAHDLRRGAARDTANLNSKGKGIANKVASAVLGHNSNKANRQITAHYVGAHDDDIWTKRIDENYVDSIYHIPDTDIAYTRKFHAFKPEEITEACILGGLDPGLTKDRSQTSKLLKKRRQSDWRSVETRKRQMLVADTPIPPSPRESFEARPRGLTSNSITTVRIDGVDDSNIDPNLDPRLSQDYEDLCNAMIGVDDSEIHPAIHELALDSIQAGETSISAITAGMEPEDASGFVHHFSTINISCNQGLQLWGSNERSVNEREALLARLQGNSRDPVTSFMYACKHRTYGCTYSNGNRSEITRHELICHITSREIYEQLAQKDDTKTFRCTEDGCSKRYNTVGKRNAHVKCMHGWPKPCPKGCKDEGATALMFATRNALTRHMETHSPFTPTPCLFPGCTSDYIFTSPKGYRKHIQQKHRLTGVAIDPYMPYVKRSKWTPMRCRVAKCTSRATFALPNRYRAHLRDRHGMDAIQVQHAMDLVHANQTADDVEAEGSITDASVD